MRPAPGPARPPLGVRHGGVGDHVVSKAGRDGDLERRLHRRLVETGKELAGIGGFELGKRVTVIARPCAVQPTQVGSQFSGKIEPKPCSTGRNLLAEGDFDHLDLGTHHGTAAQLAIRGLDTRSCHAQICCVEPELAERSIEVDVDGDFAVEAIALFGVDVDVNAHAGGAYAGIQSMGRKSSVSRGHAVAAPVRAESRPVPSRCPR